MATSITDPSPRRSYGQYCGIARALDLVGERWTLLVVRELLLGPLRYNDLLAGLPGIGTNLLAKRLKDLVEAGIVERRTLPPPASVAVYELTSQGHRLDRVVVELGRFGGHFLPQHPDDGVISARTAVTGLTMTFRADMAADLRTTYALHLDGLAYVATVEDGLLALRPGEATDADLVIVTRARLFLELLSGSVRVRDALRSADFEITATQAGRRAPERVLRPRLQTFVEIFGWAGLDRDR